MTVHNIAIELYRWMRRVEELEKEHTALRPDAPLEEHNRLDMELSEAKKAVAHYRSLLEAQKEQPKI